MANPDKSKQKILKAKKTMPISSRKQMDILNKAKNVEALKTTGRGSIIPNGNLCLISGDTNSKCTRSEVDSSFGSNNNSVFPQKSIASSQNLTKPGEIVGSEKRLKNTDEQMCLYQKPRMTKDYSSKFSIEEAKDSQNTEVHSKYQLNESRCTTENEKNHIQKSVWYPPIVLNGTAQNTSDKRIDKMVSSVKTNSNSETHDKSQNDILSSNSCFVSAEKIPDLVNSVSSSNCSATMLKTKDFCRTCHSSTSNCEHGHLQQLSLLNINSNNGHNQKKRISSQNKENVKCMKTSEQINENACENVKRMKTSEQINENACENVKRMKTSEQINENACENVKRMKASEQINENACENVKRMKTSEKITENACENVKRMKASEQINENACENVKRMKASEQINENACENVKRMKTSEKINVCENVKHMKTSEKINENACASLGRQTALLEQVKHLIRQEICRINYKVLDEKLNELSERIGKTQCRNKHEAIACELFEKIGRLQRRMKAVLSSETDCLEQSTLSRNTVCRTAKSNMKNLDKNQEAANGPNKRVTLVKSDPLQPPEKTSQRVNLSSDFVKFVSESNVDDVMLISVENPHLKTSVTSHPTAIRKTTVENFNKSPNAKFDVGVVEKKKVDFVIDLTREGLPNCNTENPAPTLMPPSKADISSKEIIAVAENGVEEPGSFEHLPPLPEPPPLLPELTDKILDTLPPQKPVLKVKRVLRPWGIALTWNIPKINPKCAPVESYHLFLCYESSKDKLTWKKIGEIKALPLPMACTLSQFLTASKYYFTVQSKDIFGRYGPFCDIKSIPGFSENLT